MLVGRVAAVVGVNQLHDRRVAFRRNVARASGSQKRRAKEELEDYELGINDLHSRLATIMRTLTRSSGFQQVILLFVCLAAAVVGANTYGLQRDDTIGPWLSILDDVIVGAFIAESVCKIFAEGRRPWEYFRNRWNCMDFAIVLTSLLPLESDNRVAESQQAVIGLRLVRLVRVLKLMRILPNLRVLVLGLLSSLSSIGYIGLLLVLLFYLYAVLGVTTFADNDPVHFGSLHVAMLTLFRVATLEDWAEIMLAQIDGCDFTGYELRRGRCTNPSKHPIIAPVFFISFVIISAFMILNMFIGVIMSSLEDARNNMVDEEIIRAKEKEEERKRQLLPSWMRTGTGLSFRGSFTNRPTVLEEEIEATARLVALRDLVDKMADEIDYLRKVELDKWVRLEEERVQENLKKLRRVHLMSSSVFALQKGSMQKAQPKRVSVSNAMRRKLQRVSSFMTSGDGSSTNGSTTTGSQQKARLRNLAGSAVRKRGDTLSGIGESTRSLGAAAEGGVQRATKVDKARRRGSLRRAISLAPNDDQHNASPDPAGVLARRMANRTRARKADTNKSAAEVE